MNSGVLDTWLYGLTVHDNPHLDADMAYVMGTVLVRGTRRSPGWEARQIVRDGLRDVLDWLAESNR